MVHHGHVSEAGRAVVVVNALHHDNRGRSKRVYLVKKQDQDAYTPASYESLRQSLHSEMTDYAKTKADKGCRGDSRMT